MNLILLKAFCFLLLLGLMNCSLKKENQFEVQLDIGLENVILGYMRENNVDTKNKVIVTEWKVTPNDRTDIYISNMATDLYSQAKYAPSYYASLENGSVIFIYTNVENLMVRETKLITTEIQDLLLMRKISLKTDSGYQYFAPTWLYTYCAGNSSVVKKLNPLDYDFIPCDYIIRQDSVVTDSVYVMKKKL